MDTKKLLAISKKARQERKQEKEKRRQEKLQAVENENIIVVAEKLGGEIMPMFNPEIKECKEEMDYWENNMCRPNMLYKNERAYKVLVSFQDEQARWQKCLFSGKMSGIIQQEIDNLNGILPEERAIDALECVERRKNQSELQR